MLVCAHSVPASRRFPQRKTRPEPSAQQITTILVHTHTSARVPAPIHIRAPCIRIIGIYASTRGCRKRNHARSRRENSARILARSGERESEKERRIELVRSARARASERDGARGREGEEDGERERERDSLLRSRRSRAPRRRPAAAQFRDARRVNHGRS